MSVSDYGGLRIVLGSQSAGRQSVLRNAGIDFECMSADIDEKAVTVQGSSDTDRSSTDPTILTVEIAKAKAKALLGRLKGQDTILITSGTYVRKQTVG
jgi:predicted house-cleaning NTP pyrophosphatase (Maf/HAM1 superfamily)